MSEVALKREDLPWYYQTKIQAVLIFLWILMEKTVAHVYTVFMIYAGVPMQYSYAFAAIICMLGIRFVWKGIHVENNEVRASWYGFMAGSFIWTGGMEMWHHAMGKYNMQPVVMKDGVGTFIPSFGPMEGPVGGIRPFFMGEHAYLQSTSLMCIVLFILMFMNKDVTCRMLQWFRRVLNMRPGKPTRGMQQQHARVAATEYIFVNWFMYVVMLAVLDERTFGADHMLTYAVTAGIAIWAAYIIYLQTKQREAGMAIRYAIAVAGVFWFLPEMTTLWGWYAEPWVNFYNGSTQHNINAVFMLFVIAAYIWLCRVYYKTPVNPKTGKSL